MLWIKTPAAMLCVLMTGYVFSCTSTPAQADIIDFDGVSPGYHSLVTIGPYQIWYASIDDRGGNLPSQAAATTREMYSGSPMTITRTDGQPFLLTSFDVEGSFTSGSVASIGFEIYGYGEDEIPNLIDDDGDGVIDEPDQVLFSGQLTDALLGLESFSFVGATPHRQWAFAVSPSQFGGPQVHFDNINAVPEPGTAGLLGFGLVGFLFRRRSRAA